MINEEKNFDGYTYTNLPNQAHKEISGQAETEKRYNQLNLNLELGHCRHLNINRNILVF